MKIFINNEFVNDQKATIPFNDRGFLLGDGIFETMRIYEEKPFALNEHYKRLKQSADFLHLPLKLSLDAFKQVAGQLIVLNHLEGKDASLRITLTRGPTTMRGIAPPQISSPTTMVTISPLTVTNTSGLKAIISPIRRNEFSPLSNIKSLCYLDNILAKRDALDRGVDDCIMLNTKGNIACASVANLFIVEGESILTPGLEEGILPGITRKTLIEICKANHFSVRETPITLNQLMSAKEVFITNSLIELQPIIQINSLPINHGTVGRTIIQLQQLYKQQTAMSC